ncbi:GRP family sugar transporter [Trueperella pyogenes]|uniref:GRP family sugar transporter n=1 Tax=Trueperella pyogenes TaxID=1661 RepID=UPI00215D48A2|nr:GRP family sugar transporter [Trueperella pyogenes]UVJ58994.1 GRP family sugar transporter [Trueperella pyogenes]
MATILLFASDIPQLRLFSPYMTCMVEEPYSLWVDILFALTPVIFMGPLSIVLALTGGTIRQQTVGQLAGALIVAGLALPFLSPQWTAVSFWVPFIGGASCAVGIAMQLYSFRLVGVSRTMPISMGLQIIVTGLGGVILFNEWATAFGTILGLCAMTLIIAGIALTSYSEHENVDGTMSTTAPDGPVGGASAKVVDRATMRKGLALNVVSAFLLCAYMVWIRWEGIDYQEFIFPLALGMTVGAIVIAVVWRDGQPLIDRTFFKLLLIPGLMFGVGVMLMQVANQVVGVATGFTISQVGVVISVFGGIVWLHESKTRKELAAAWIGVLFVLIGAAVIGYTKSLA